MVTQMCVVLLEHLVKTYSASYIWSAGINQYMTSMPSVIPDMHTIPAAVKIQLHTLIAKGS